MPQYVKDKIRAAMTGRKLSQETKNKISIGQKNAWAKIPHIQPEKTSALIGKSETNTSNSNENGYKITK